MRTCLWALASICFELTSWSAVNAAAPDPAAPVEVEDCESPVPARGLELERELALTRDIYLRLDERCREVGVLAGGVELTAVPFAALELLGYRPARGAPDGVPAVDLPAVVTVVDDLSAASRRIVAPDFLRPYSERDESTPPVEPAGQEAPAEVAAGGEERDEAFPPSSYRVRLEGGWVLDLGPRPAAHGFPTRIAQALRDGWLRLAGESPDRPHRIVLAIGPEDARRLHHLFRAGTRILVLAGPPE